MSTPVGLVHPLSRCSGLFVAALIGCVAPPDQTQPVPAHEIVATEDVSYSTVRRYNLRVALPEYYSQEEIERIVQATVADITNRERINAVSIMFYSPGTETSGAWNVAMVEWAPNGQWGDAGSVDAGDYGSFRYDVSYRPPVSTESAPIEATDGAKSAIFSAEGFIKVVGDGANIRTAPDGTIIVQAQRGEVFEARGQEGEWQLINMFSGEHRYIHTSLVTPAQEAPPLPSSEGSRRRAFAALLQAEDQAWAEAEAQGTSVRRVLNDRYKLEVSHRFGIHAVHYTAISVEGVRKNWD